MVVELSSTGRLPRLCTFYTRDVVQMVERSVRDAEVVGSSPAIPTILDRTAFK